MKIIIYRNREVYKENSKIGNDSENKVETLDFEFPEEFKDFNKYIEFQIKGEKCVDLIRNNQYVITRSIAKYGKIKTQIVLKKIIDNDTVVFKSNIFTVNVSASINASEEIEQTLQVDIIQTLTQNISEIENKVADLEKDKVSIITLEDYAKKSEIPTKTSDLTNDSGFIDKTYHDETKVDKVVGKGLSTNDYTDEDKTKLDNLHNYDDTAIKQRITNAEDDIDDLETTVAGHTTAIGNKADKTEIPTKISDLTNDSNFVSDGNYVHTDVNFTAEKDTKLAGLNNYDDTQIVQEISKKADKVLVVESTTTTLEIQENKFYKFGEVTELNLTLSEITDTTQLNEFMFEFVSGATATTLTLPSSVKWLETPTIESNKIYQCSIVNNIGILVGVANV